MLSTMLLVVVVFVLVVLLSTIWVVVVVFALLMLATTISRIDWSRSEMSIEAVAMMVSKVIELLFLYTLRDRPHAGCSGMIPPYQFVAATLAKNES